MTAKSTKRRAGDISAFLQGLTTQPIVDFGTAHYKCFDAAAHVPAEEMARVRGDGDPRLAQVIEAMLRRETSIAVEDYAIHPCAGSTRVALGHVFEHFTRQGRPVGVPLPNWLFWKLQDDAGKSYAFHYLDAVGEGDVVASFRKAAADGAVSALLIGSPSTPLGHYVSAEMAQELDTIATRYGIGIIVDDVRRGGQPLDQRDSIARHFARPFVVEGLGHRLGEERCGEFSYVLVPEGEPVADIGRWGGEEVASAPARLLRLMLEHGSQPALDEIRARNAALDLGLREAGPQGIVIHRPEATHVTSLLTLPPDYPIDGTEFSKRAWQAHDNIVVVPMYAFFPAKRRVPDELAKSFRISVGNIPAARMYEAALKLGRALTSEVAAAHA